MGDESKSTPQAAPPRRWRVVAGGLSFVLGLIARIGVPRMGARVPGAGRARLGIVLGILVIALSITAFLLLPSVDLARESAKQATCQNNLKSIALCMKLYAEDNGGAFPDRWSALYPTYLNDPLYLVCPSSAQKPGDPARIDEWAQYTLVPGLRPTGTPADAQALVCYDNEERHTPPGRNELYLDGHVEFRKQGSVHILHERL